MFLVSSQTGFFATVLLYLGHHSDNGQKIRHQVIRDHLPVSSEKPCPLTHSPSAAGHFGNGPFFRVPRSQSNSCYFSWWFSQLLRGPSQASMTSSPPSRACGLPSFAVLRKQRRRYF